jgi:anti-sigma regulatory factor (Ser/Thr protein kinase)
MHTEAVTGESAHSVTFALPAGTAAPARARQHVAEYAAGMAANLTDAVLLVSELVNNAVQHGRPDILLTIGLHRPGISVGVRDHGPAFEPSDAHMPDPDLPQGRGLRFVELLSDAWGVEPVDPPPGKAVWFELDEPSVADPNR